MSLLSALGRHRGRLRANEIWKRLDEGNDQEMKHQSLRNAQHLTTSAGSAAEATTAEYILRRAAFGRLKGGLLVATLFGAMLLSGCSSSGGDKDGALGEGGLGGNLSDQNIESEQSRFRDGNIPSASEGGKFPDVHFDYDSSVVQQADYEIVRQNTKALVQDSSLHAEIEGHCDKRGTAEYNLALGEERAKAVAALMVGFGAKPEQLSTISYGEEIPVDPRDSDDAYAKNRRAHFAIYRKSASK